jgi:hypothetical protein
MLRTVDNNVAAAALVVKALDSTIFGCYDLWCVIQGAVWSQIPKTIVPRSLMQSGYVERASRLVDKER